jgi:transcription initiation factor TFIID TATA-box-binding protein
MKLKDLSKDLNKLLKIDNMAFNIRIENIVASTSLNAKIKLEKIFESVEGMEYEPEQFPGLVYRIDKPKAAALIFSSGKIICTGARNMNDVKEVFEKIAKVIKKSGIEIPKNYKIEVENIVASVKFDLKINLDTIAFNLENSEYEPEQFPGLVYRMDQPKVALLFFSSGKVICTGGRNIKDIKVAIEKIYSKLKSIKAFVK